MIRKHKLIFLNNLIASLSGKKTLGLSISRLQCQHLMKSQVNFDCIIIISELLVYSEWWLSTYNLKQNRNEITRSVRIIETEFYWFKIWILGFQEEEYKLSWFIELNFIFHIPRIPPFSKVDLLTQVHWPGSSPLNYDGFLKRLICTVNLYQWKRSQES